MHAATTQQAGDLSLPDRLADLAAQEATGCLTVVDDEGYEAEIWLRSGAVYELQAPGPRPMLGVRLMSTGVVTPEVLALALEEQRRLRPARRLGEVLVELGVVAPQVVEEFLVEQLADALADVLDWQLTEADFRDGATASAGLAQPVEVADLLAQARHRVADWSDVAGGVGGADVVPMLATRPAGEQDVVLGPMDWALLCKIDGQRTLRALAADCGFTVVEAAQVLAGLHAAGLVDCGPGDVAFRPPPVAPQPWVSDLAGVTAALRAVVARTVGNPSADTGDSTAAIAPAAAPSAAPAAEAAPDLVLPTAHAPTDAPRGADVLPHDALAPADTLPVDAVHAPHGPAPSPPATDVDPPRPAPAEPHYVVLPPAAPMPAHPAPPPPPVPPVPAPPPAPPAAPAPAPAPDDVDSDAALTAALTAALADIANPDPDDRDDGAASGERPGHDAPDDVAAAGGREVIGAGLDDGEPDAPASSDTSWEANDTAALMRELSSLSAVEPEVDDGWSRAAGGGRAPEQRRKRRGLFGR